jgi:hypothetical protein
MLRQQLLSRRGAAGWRERPVRDRRLPVPVLGGGGQEGLLASARGLHVARAGDVADRGVAEAGEVLVGDAARPLDVERHVGARAVHARMAGLAPAAAAAEGNRLAAAALGHRGAIVPGEAMPAPPVPA